MVGRWPLKQFYRPGTYIQIYIAPELLTREPSTG